MYTGEIQWLMDELHNYGVNNNCIRLFSDTISWKHLNYLDLIEPRDPDKQKELLPDGVAENQGFPLLFFVNESRLALSTEETETKLNHLRRILACRGDRAYLARIRPGELLVIPVSLFDRTPEWKLYNAKSSDAMTFFSRLAHGHFEGKGKPDGADFVFKEMLSLLNHGADQLAQLIGPANVLSLLGRALFFRFLCDRNIVTEQDIKCIAPNASSLVTCFDNAQNAYATSQWLDQTFNGDFLPLDDGGSRRFFDMMAKQSNSVFFHLSAIVKRFKPVGTEAYQTKQDWSNFDFAHVPVGLLSQVYEAFCWKWEHTSAKETSVYYTPRRIASILVDEAFDGLPRAHEARVLDPACGAGVFLVLTFRRLYQERWKAFERPNTKTIREILEKQLVGFDISSSALKLAALGLYLTAIELDPKPIPPEKLRFEELNNLVLFNHRRHDIDKDDGPVIGSLGNHIGTRFDGQFDLVISNPPWTSLPKEYKALADEFTNISKTIIARRGDPKLAYNYQNPDFAPDLPFVWKSSEWCRADGRIAMVLPARILLKQEDIPRYARETVFQLIQVTGILNGSNLSDTQVWPKISQPFMLFFAQNRNPAHDQVMRFITPHYDLALSNTGEMRLDSKSAQPVELSTVTDEPWLWKTMAIGTPLDIEVIRKIKSVDGLPLDRYWREDLGLVNGNGYQVAEGQKQKDATFLLNLPNLNSTTKFRFEVRSDQLQPFKRLTLAWPRRRHIYSGPLVLVNVTPGEHREEGRALLALTDIAYNESFNGYSAAGLKNGDLLVRYLHLFVHSNIWSHYTLMVSAEFGAERRKFHKSDLDNFPIIPISSLSVNQLKTVKELSSRLTGGDPSVFSEIDTFFGGLYGLDALDLEVITDTLHVGLPFNDARKEACRCPSYSEFEIFRSRLENILRPFFKVLGKDPQVILWRTDDAYLKKAAPFGIILIGERGHSIIEPNSLFRDIIFQLANDTGATRIIQHLDESLLIGVLRQYRYWTPSRARLLGAEIVRQHMCVFEE